MRFGIVELYCGKSGKKGFYNSQEIGLAKAMKQLGYEPVIFFPAVGQSDLREEQTEEGILIVHVPAKAIGVHSLYDWNVLLRYNIRIAQIGSDNQMFAPDVLNFCDRHKVLAYNYIGTMGSDTNIVLKKSISKLLFQRNQRAYRKYKCFAKTPTVARQLEEYGVETVEIAPVGLDISIIPHITQDREELRKLLDLPNDKVILLFVGRLDEYKRPLEAVRLLSMLGDSVYLVMIGTGNMDKQVDQEAKRLGVERKMTRIASISNSAIHKYYVASDYFINFNRNEIFGMSILEAMYQGCTVIAYHAPGPDYIIENGISGFLVNNSDEIALIVQCGKYVMEEVAYKRILEQFTWNKTAEMVSLWVKRNIGKSHN